MLKLIKSFDTYGKVVNFNLNQNDSYKTVIGGLISMLIFIAGICSLWYFGQDIYLKSSPNFLSSAEYKYVIPEVSLNNSNFFFGIRIEDMNGNTLWDPHLFDIELFYYYYKNSKGNYEQVNSSKVDLRPCNENDVPNKSDFDYFLLFNYWCADLGNIKIGGNWDQDNIGYLSYRMKACDKIVEEEYNITCSPDSVLYNYPQKLFFSYILQKDIIDPRNFLDPINTIYDYSYIDLDPKASIRQRNYYSTAIITDDIGWIFSELVDRLFMQFDERILTFRSTRDGNNLIDLGIYLNRKHYIYERVYIKIPDIAAIVGGFFSLILPLVDLLYGYYIDNEYTVYMYKKLFNLDIDYNEMNNVKDKVNNIELSMKQQHNNLNNLDANVNKNNMYKTYEEIHQPHSNNHSNIKASNISNNPNLSSSYILPSTFNNPNLSSSYILPPTFNNPIQIPNINETNFPNPASPNNNPDNKNHIDIKSKKLINNKKPKPKTNYKDIENIIANKSRTRQRINIVSCERCYFILCCFNSSYKNQNDNQKLRKFELMEAADVELSNKSDFLNYVKLIDQFRLIKKIILNENQCFMIDNRDLQTIINKNNNTDSH